LALAVVIVGGVGVGMLPALGVAVGVVAVVALVVVVDAVGRPPGIDVGAFGEAMRNANDREGAAPATGTANSASNVAPSARTRETIRPADAAAEG
jgi:hypothetical protein